MGKVLVDTTDDKNEHSKLVNDRNQIVNPSIELDDGDDTISKRAMIPMTPL